MDFGTAVTAMRNGARVARKGWNGDGVWLIHTETGRMTVRGDKGAMELVLDPFIVTKTASGTFTPWLPSQADLLAMDWSIVQ